jgi:hypothetical protein
MARATLLPTNKRLKQVIKEFGNPWEILSTGEMQCFNGRIGIRIKSQCGKHLRNVEVTDVKIEG